MPVNERGNMPSNSVYRNKKLLDSAEGQPCVICGSVGTTVAAHANSVALGKGTGIKCPDLYTAHVCRVHHDMIDGRRMLEGPYSSPFEMWMWAYLKTVKRWFESGIVK